MHFPVPHIPLACVPLVSCNRRVSFGFAAFCRQLSDGGQEFHGLHSFTILLKERELVVAAHSLEEKYKWTEVGRRCGALTPEFNRSLFLA